MGQLLVPAMIGAGVGAVGGAATGKNPFKTALLGAAVGAGGAGAGLFGGGAAAGTAGTGAGAGLIGGANLSTAGGLGSGAAGGLGGLFSGLQGVATTPVSMGTGGFASGIGGQVIPNVTANVAPVIETAAQTASQNFIPQNLVGNATGSNVSNFVENTPFMPNTSRAVASAPDFTPVLGKSAEATGGGYNPSFFGRIDDAFGNPLSSLTGRDKLNLGLQGIGMLNQPQQMIQPQVMPITRGNPDMVSSPLYNVAPNVGRQEGNEVGLPNLFSQMPLTEEEKIRLQQMAQQRYRG